MIDIHKIMDEMTRLELEINDKAKDIRLAIVESLIKAASYNGTDSIIADATKLARFVERGDERSDYERLALPHAEKPLTSGIQPIAPGLQNIKINHSSITHRKLPREKKAKRKYTKKSTFWKKKK